MSLAYLWHQPQTRLLRDMIDCGIEAVLVKVRGRRVGGQGFWMGVGGDGGLQGRRGLRLGCGKEGWAGDKMNGGRAWEEGGLEEGG